MSEQSRETGRRSADAAAKVRARREAAARARRLAQSVIQDDDRAQLLDYAKSLDAEADSLERQARSMTRKQEQPQQQAQQQQAPPQPPANPTNGRPGNGKKPKG